MDNAMWRERWAQVAALLDEGRNDEALDLGQALAQNKPRGMMLNDGIVHTIQRLAPLVKARLMKEDR